MIEQTINSWSFTREADFQKCRLLAKLKYIDKVSDTSPRTAADRGTAIHTEAENFVSGTGPLTANLADFATELSEARNLYSQGIVSMEQEWGFDMDWKPTDWQSAWLRIKCDLVILPGDDHGLIIDHKTGRRIGNEVKHAEQGQLYAVAGFERYPNLTSISTEFWYLDQNEITSNKFQFNQTGRLFERWHQRGMAMTTNTDWSPNPNIFNCKWCPYGPWGTGHCAVGVKK